MELIIIACCKTKRMSGNKQFSTSPLANCLSEETFYELMTSRKKLSAILNLPPGPDLGLVGQENSIEFLPAYQRYNGIIYQENNFGSVYPKLIAQNVIIISALYGVLDASELIRNYELKMDHTLPIGVKVKTWWKSRGLGSIVRELVCNDAFQIVHDLLPKAYRDALRPWPPQCNNGNLSQYDYPGQGSGSIWRRADDLNNLLKPKR